MERSADKSYGPAAAPVRPAAAAWLETVFKPVEAFFNRVYTSRWSPLNYSGEIAVVCFLVMLLTGLYLFLFYSVSTPYESIRELNAQWWGGRWIRGLHRYASDLAIIAVVVHAFKNFIAGRSWGPRVLAWMSGVVMVGFALLCGWTGMVMVWDTQAQLVAVEGAKLLDLVPIFSEPISRSFVSDNTMPNSFFFMNLFLHVALPLVLAFLLWIHTSRIARPRLLPPKAATWALVGLLVLVSAVWPPPLPDKADLLAIPGRIPTDMIYGFWLPVSRAVSPVVHGLLWLLAALILFTVPLWWRPKSSHLKPSLVDINRCTGCTQCYEDCPYDAISMVPRREPSRLSEFVADVDPDLCTSCGICSASCAPMSIGIPLWNGKDQVRRIGAYFDAAQPGPRDVVVLSCQYGNGTPEALRKLEGVKTYKTGCSGSVHTSVVEYLVRRGVGGVYVLTCAGSDCLYREGPKWLDARVYHDREAELKPRVDKERVRIGAFAPTELARAVSDVENFRRSVCGLAENPGEANVAFEEDCATSTGKS